MTEWQGKYEAERVRCLGLQREIGQLRVQLQRLTQLQRETSLRARDLQEIHDVTLRILQVPGEEVSEKPSELINRASLLVSKLQGLTQEIAILRDFCQLPARTVTFGHSLIFEKTAL